MKTGCKLIDSALSRRRRKPTLLLTAAVILAAGLVIGALFVDPGWLRTAMLYAGAAAAFCALVELIHLAFVIRKNKRFAASRREAEWQVIGEQLGKEDVTVYEEEKLYLTEDYLVSVSGMPDVLRISDAVWVYKGEKNGKKGSIRFTHIVTKDKKRHDITMVSADPQAIITLITSKDAGQSLLVGESKENARAAKKLYEKHGG